jgi:hypothetical protein
MNGCAYLQPKFTLPASSNTGQIMWDYAFLTKAEFIAKWGKTPYEFAKAGAVK